jgi:hypothetical protein
LRRGFGFGFGDVGGGGAFWCDGDGGFVGEGGGVGVGFADDSGGFGCGVEAAGVGGGEVESVEDGAAVLEVDLVVAMALTTLEMAIWMATESSRGPRSKLEEFV